MKNRDSRLEGSRRESVEIRGVRKTSMASHASLSGARFFRLASTLRNPTAWHGAREGGNDPDGPEHLGMHRHLLPEETLCRPRPEKPGPTASLMFIVLSCSPCRGKHNRRCRGARGRFFSPRMHKQRRLGETGPRRKPRGKNITFYASKTKQPAPASPSSLPCPHRPAPSPAASRQRPTRPPVTGCHSGSGAVGSSSSPRIRSRIADCGTTRNGSSR